MSNQPLNNEQQQIALVERIVERYLISRGFERPLRSTLDASFGGGNPASKRTGATATDTETHQVLMAIPWIPRASDDLLEQPMGGGMVVAKIGALPSGKLNVGAFWQLPNLSLPGTEGTFASTTSTVLYHNPLPIVISTVQITISTPQSGKNWGVKLLSSDDVQLFDTGNQSATSSGVRTATLGSAFFAPPGWYKVNYYSDDATVAVKATAYASDVRNHLGVGASVPWVRFGGS